MISLVPSFWSVKARGREKVVVTSQGRHTFPWTLSRSSFDCLDQMVERIQGTRLEYEWSVINSFFSRTISKQGSERKFVFVLSSSRNMSVQAPEFSSARVTQKVLGKWSRLSSALLVWTGELGCYHETAWWSRLCDTGRLGMGFGVSR